MEQPLQFDWKYKSGQQYPSLWTPLPGTSIDKTLTNHKMIEVLAINGKNFSAVCHACKEEYKNTSARNLAAHVESLKHKHYLQIDPLSSIDPKEQVRRQGILENVAFSTFLQFEDGLLSCKFCKVELPFDSNKLHAHSIKLEHQSKIASMTSGIQQFKVDNSDPNRLAKMQALVAKYRGQLALVTKADLLANSLLESFASNSSIELNDIYCTTCRQVFDRIDPNRFRQAIQEHFITERHTKAVTKKEDRKKEEEKRIQSGIQSRAPTTPPRKISHFRTSEEELKEVGRHFVSTNLAVSQCDSTNHRLADGIVHRPVSAKGMLKGISLLAEGNCSA